MANQLRAVLDTMFPNEYLARYHPIGGCTLLELRCRQEHQDQSLSSMGEANHLCQVSTKPGNRVQIRSLASKLDVSLKTHLARPNGLCPIRRAIFDQCFDELIRQTTINCLESGLILFRLRNELIATQNSFKDAYESGVRFGIKKALCAEIELAKKEQKINDLKSAASESEMLLSHRLRSDELELDNKADRAERMKKIYEDEIAKRDQVIEQQRAIIKSLSQNIITEMTASNQSRRQQQQSSDV